MEIRTLNTEFQQTDEQNLISGIAIRFNSESEVLYDSDNKRFFREVIAPSAITQELVDNSDIRFLINHDKNKLVARRRNGKGSLNVEVREDGVYFSFECPNTTYGQDLREQIKRGEISQCSFAFIEGRSKWDFSGDLPLRTITEVRGLFDLSGVYTPAYSETEINARSIDELQKEYEENTDWKKEINHYRELI